ncbi:MAG: ribonuclease P protein component [Acidobacteria bacterium]|nr:ribonuclease P protein component [Acidobacteriota bacterium]
MLARANRVVRAEDFRAVVRRGRRSVTPSAVYYQLPREPGAPVRFGIIVAKSVGNAVDRNLVRRRYRALGRELVQAGAHGVDVVVRALPGAAQQSWTGLSGDMNAALDLTVLNRRNRVGGA